jgi:hypothetical protein
MHLARTSTAVARPLKVLVPLIRADVDRGDSAGMEYYADAGDKLIEAKDQVAPGYWPSWLKKNFALGDSTARNYMRLARLRAENPAGVLPNSLRQMDGRTERSRKQRAAERAYKSVLRELETDEYAQERQRRKDEVQLHREIALQLIDVGWKALATRLHPDRGGSKEAMVRLNRVRKELKDVAQTRRFL